MHGDFAHYFPGRDALVEWRSGRMPLIELAALYGWLPPESRTKSAQAGDTTQLRWSQSDWMHATTITYLQSMVRILWVGLQLKGQPPEFTPIKTPAVDRTPTPQEVERRAAHQARVAQLRKYSPTYQQGVEQQAG